MKKLPGWKRRRDGEAVLLDVFLEDGGDFGKIETDAGDVGILKRDLNDEIALRGAAVGSGLVFVPGKFCGDGRDWRHG